MEELKDRVKDLEKVLPEINTKLGVIEALMKEPHTCKWDKEINILWDDKIEVTPPIRSNIFTRLDKNENEIVRLGQNDAVTQRNNELLEKLIKGIQDNDSKNSDRSFSIVQGITLIIVASVISLIIGYFR